MEQHKRVEEVPTLGTFIRELRPGSACICCGAPLEWTIADDSSRSGEWSPSDPETRGLTCPYCGCEVDDGSAYKTASTTGRVLNRAA
jgi:DNA-directed RNA polymerase subunit RPC12/RpoP